MAENEADALDLVWGAEEIARIIGRTPQQVYHMLRTGKLPAKHIGERWVVSRQKLIEFCREDAA